MYTRDHSLLIGWTHCSVVSKACHDNLHPLHHWRLCFYFITQTDEKSGSRNVQTLPTFTPHTRPVVACWFVIYIVTHWCKFTWNTSSFSEQWSVREDFQHVYRWPQNHLHYITQHLLFSAVSDVQYCAFLSLYQYSSVLKHLRHFMDATNYVRMWPHILCSLDLIYRSNFRESVHITTFKVNLSQIWKCQWKSTLRQVLYYVSLCFTA